MRRAIILLTLFFLSSILMAQTTKNFGWYSSKTYELYLANNWRELTKIGEEALDADIDFYYLRIRLGIAFYELEEYRNAIPHFDKALTFYSEDALAAEYLYYAFKYSGRIQDANLTYAKYKSLLKYRNVTPDFGFFAGGYTEGGLKFLSPPSETVGTLKYIHVGMQQQLGNRLSLYHGYTRISRNFSSFDPSNFVQNEYYGKATVPLITGLQAMASVHTQTIASTTNYSNLAFLVGITTNTKIIDFSLNYGRAQINNVTQEQTSIGAVFYPIPSQKLYLQSIFTYHLEATQSNIIFYQKLGIKVEKRTWLDVYGSFGDVRNVQDMDGFYLYNIADHLVMRLGTTANVYLGNRAKLLVGYTFESLEVIDTNFPYKQHYVFTGLQFSLKK